jgi:hypothetical protein
MRKRCGLAIATIGVISLLGVSNAAAAVEVGSNCAATSGVSNYTLTQLAHGAGNALPLTAPGAGVVTKWKVNSKVGAEFQEQLRVLRGSGKTFQTVAESAPAGVSAGQHTFDTQIPVQAGDRFAVFAGPTSTALYCTSPAAGEEMGVFNGDATVGSTNEYAPVANAHVALAVVIEPDVDGDGFGDETQDKCTRSAKLQTECPLLALSSFGIASRNSALILVASSSSAPVTVAATVTVPGKVKKGKKGKAKVLNLSGGTQTIAPGQLGRFVLSYSVPLKAALTALSRKRSLSLNVTASATDATGLPSSSTTTLRLKGQAKPKK